MFYETDESRLTELLSKIKEKGYDIVLNFDTVVFRAYWTMRKQMLYVAIFKYRKLVFRIKSCLVLIPIERFI